MEPPVPEKLAMEKNDWFSQVVDAKAPHRAVVDRKIRFEAEDLCKKGIAHFSEADREDIIQDLWLGVARGWDKYDPSRGGISTYCYQLIRSARSLLIRKRLAKVRAGGFETVRITQDGDEARSVKFVAEWSIPAAEGTLADKLGRDEIIAFAESQPEPFRSVLLRYMTGELRSITAMADELGVPVSTFRRNYLGKFRKRFEKHFEKVVD